MEDVALRIAICDDSWQDQEEFASILRGWDSTKWLECFTDGEQLLAAARKQPPFDLVFLDIYMPGENGVDVARKLKVISPGTGIVFVTTSREHAVDAFSLHALHYLVKPVTRRDVIESFRRLEQLAERKRPAVVLSVGSGSYTAFLDEICCVQSTGHVKEIFLANGKILRVRQTLEELETALGSSFLKLNRGTLVNMDRVEQMGTDTCLLQDGTQLGIARRERQAIRTAYDNYLFSQLNGRTGFGREVEP